MRKSKHLDLNSRYSFPAELRTVRFDGKILIIAPISLTWIVLDNEAQLRFFSALQSSSIASAIAASRVSEADARHVLTQIEARGLCSRPAGLVEASENVEHMQFFLTDGCNLRCPHCLMKATVKGPDELSTDEVRSVLAAFKGNGGRAVTFSGGEIALRADLAEIVDFCSQIGLSAELLTNGTLWTESLVGKVAGKVRRVQVSIDGFSEASNAPIRGEGSFEKSLRTVDMFVQAGVMTEVAVTPMLTESLESEAPRYVAWTNALRDKYRGCRFNFRFTGNLLDGREVTLTDEERERYSRITDIIRYGFFGRNLDVSVFASFVKDGILKTGCTFGSFNVTANGNVFACGRVAGMKPVANVRTDDVQEVFKGLRALTRLSRVDNITPCNACELRYFCGGDCRIVRVPAFAGLGGLNPLPDIAELTQSCPPGQKERYYRQMIDTNPLFFA